MKNKKNSYSIRKLSVGASSIIVASMLFIGGGSVHAAESNHLENQEQSEVVHHILLRCNTKIKKLNKLRIKIIKLTIQKQLIRLQLYITMATHIMRHLVLTLNLMKTNKLIVNPINLRHLCQIMINKTLKSSGTYNEKYKCKKEETRKNENAKSLVQPQQDDKTTSEQTKMKESREQEITNEQKQLQSKDVKMLNKKIKI